ncbi:hypothetical protein BDZ89DRAFT_1238634 [Hymenopellis radicata]|nr:hypothetical protein BDZ89DRAFT_1238634 [Hymenopellis radicata]
MAELWLNAHQVWIQLQSLARHASDGIRMIVPSGKRLGTPIIKLLFFSPSCAPVGVENPPYPQARTALQEGGDPKCRANLVHQSKKWDRMLQGMLGPLVLATNDSAGSAVWLSVESPEHAILGDSDLVDIRTALLDPKLPHRNLARLPTDNGDALDTCLPLVAKLIYDTMELFKSFELQRPMHSKPLPAVRTWHRRIPGLKTRQPAAHAPLGDSDSDSYSDYVL